MDIAGSSRRTIEKQRITKSFAAKPAADAVSSTPQTKMQLELRLFCLNNGNLASAGVPALSGRLAEKKRFHNPRRLKPVHQRSLN
ncbi:MAG: hypothetical protein Q8M16_01210 [Pirellulaceae bacterium]|nr:hypothetical protein [Pirellulaceae bacterium]